LTTIAPTGTISLIAGVSSGIEPVFAFHLKRRVMDTLREEVHPIYQKYKSEGRQVPETIFQSAWQVKPEWHLKIQEAFQAHTDSAVSKTVNFPKDATAEDIRSLFLLAARSKVKGVTVYRDQSRSAQILTSGEPGCAGCQ
jgi:ribonucleoside-diphosphate reductase alpha chain